MATQIVEIIQKSTGETLKRNQTPDTLKNRYDLMVEMRDVWLSEDRDGPFDELTKLLLTEITHEIKRIRPLLPESYR